MLNYVIVYCDISFNYIDGLKSFHMAFKGQHIGDRYVSIFFIDPIGNIKLLTSFLQRFALICVCGFNRNFQK